jgi:hypothetical protein
VVETDRPTNGRPAYELNRFGSLPIKSASTPNLLLLSRLTATAPLQRWLANSQAPSSFNGHCMNLNFIIDWFPQKGLRTDYFPSSICPLFHITVPVHLLPSFYFALPRIFSPSRSDPSCAEVPKLQAPAPNEPFNSYRHVLHRITPQPCQVSAARHPTAVKSLTVKYHVVRSWQSSVNNSISHEEAEDD